MAVNNVYPGWLFKSPFSEQPSGSPYNFPIQRIFNGTIYSAQLNITRADAFHHQRYVVWNDIMVVFAYLLLKWRQIFEVFVFVCTDDVIVQEKHIVDSLNVCMWRHIVFLFGFCSFQSIWFPAKLRISCILSQLWNDCFNLRLGSYVFWTCGPNILSFQNHLTKVTRVFSTWGTIICSKCQSQTCQTLTAATVSWCLFVCLSPCSY